jgi:hypothetical protein
MKLTLRRLTALFGAALVALAIVIPIPAAAYEGQISVILIETVPAGIDLRCPGGTVLEATVVPADEETSVNNLELIWTLTTAPNAADPDRLVRTTTRTNANGVSHNTIILAPTSTTGTRTITVTAVDPGFGTNTFFATCRARGGQQPGGEELPGAGAQTPPFTGLPGTDALPAGSVDPMPFAMLLGLIALVATIGYVPRLRRRQTR